MNQTKLYYIAAYTDDAEDLCLFVESTSIDKAKELWKEYFEEYDEECIEQIWIVPALTGKPHAFAWGQDMKAELINVS